MWLDILATRFLSSLQAFPLDFNEIAEKKVSQDKPLTSAISSKLKLIRRNALGSQKIENKP